MATQVTLNSGSVDSAGSLALKTNGTTTAVTINASQGVEFNAGTASAPSITTTGDTNTGIFFPAADTIAFSEGGVESMRINSSGNVGLGVTPSASWNSGYKAIQIANAGYGSLSGQVAGASAMQLSWGAYATGADTWAYLTTGDSVSQYIMNSALHRWRYAASGTAGNTISWTQGMTLDSSGNLLVGATSTAFPSSDAKIVSLTNSVQTAFFANVNAASSTGTAGIVIRKYDNNNTTSQIYLHCNYNQGTSGAGGIQGNGASGVQFYSSSDARLKENIVELEPQLANILALKPSKFDYIDGPKDCTGFIAQEMEAVYPDAIGETPDGFKTIGGISIMETRLIKAIQEQQAIITQLQADVAALKGTA